MHEELQHDRAGDHRRHARAHARAHVERRHAHDQRDRERAHRCDHEGGRAASSEHRRAGLHASPLRDPEPDPAPRDAGDHEGGEQGPAAPVGDVPDGTDHREKGEIDRSLEAFERGEHTLVVRTGEVAEHEPGQEADGERRELEVPGHARRERDHAQQERLRVGLRHRPAHRDPRQNAERDRHAERHEEPARAGQVPSEVPSARAVVRAEGREAEHGGQRLELRHAAGVLRRARTHAGPLQGSADRRGRERSGESEQRGVARDGRGAGVRVHGGEDPATGERDEERGSADDREHDGRAAARYLLDGAEPEAEPRQEADPPETQHEERREMVQHAGRQHGDAGRAGHEAQAHEWETGRQELRNTEALLPAPYERVRAQGREPEQEDEPDHRAQEERARARRRADGLLGRHRPGGEESHDDAAERCAGRSHGSRLSPCARPFPRRAGRRPVSRAMPRRRRARR